MNTLLLRKSVMMNKRIILAALVGCFVFQTKAQKSEPYKPAVFTDAKRIEKIQKTFSIVDSIYKKHATDNNFPAISFGIVVDGKLMYKNSYGFLDVANKVPATSASLFRIASMSKSFACMAILKLRDEGKLNLDDPAYLYIPELKNIHYPTTDASAITIRNLMSHSAGFPEDNPWGDRQLADTDTELMEFIKIKFRFLTYLVLHMNILIWDLHF